jgi:hypothetical protein
MHDFEIRQVDGGVGFTVRVIPSSSKTAFMGVLDGMLKVKVSAAPERGKANKCLIDFLAKQLKIKKNMIKIASGTTNSIKQIQISGVKVEDIRDRLEVLSF